MLGGSLSSYRKIRTAREIGGRFLQSPRRSSCNILASCHWGLPLPMGWAYSVLSEEASGVGAALVVRVPHASCCANMKVDIMSIVHSLQQGKVVTDGRKESQTIIMDSVWSLQYLLRIYHISFSYSTCQKDAGNGPKMMSN